MDLHVEHMTTKILGEKKKERKPLIPEARPDTKSTAHKRKTGKVNLIKIKNVWNFPSGPVVKNLPYVGDTGLIPGLGRFHMLKSN